MERLRRLRWNGRTVPPERARRLTGIRNEDTIVPYHTIIITYNNGSTIKYCGHSNDRLDEEGTATVLEPTENDFLIFKF